MINAVNEMLEQFNLTSMHIWYRQCPFIDQEIKELMDTMTMLHKLARRAGMFEDWKRRDDRFSLANWKTESSWTEQ